MTDRCDVIHCVCGEYWVSAIGGTAHYTCGRMLTFEVKGSEHAAWSRASHERRSVDPGSSAQDRAHSKNRLRNMDRGAA